MDALPAGSELNDRVWREIESLLAETASLATTRMSTREFYAGWLRRTLDATGALAGTVWLQDDAGRLAIEYEIRQGDASDAARQQRHLAAETVASTVQPCVLPPGAHADQGTTLQNETDDHLWLRPLMLEDRVVGVVELSFDASLSPSALGNVGEIAIAFCDHAVEFHRRRQHRELQNRDAQWGQLDRFTRTIHASLRLDVTTSSIANEATLVSACDRVSVLTRVGGRYRVKTVSGLDTIDRRSAVIRSLERLTREVCRTGEPLWHNDYDETMPVQLDGLLQQYTDESHVRALAIVPLTPPSPPQARRRRRAPKPLGAIVFERFEGDPWTEVRKRRVEQVASHSQQALRNALEYSRLPLRGLAGLATLTSPLRVSRLLQLIGLVAVLCGIGAALCLVETDFAIRAKGVLQPKLRRHVFAPADAVVELVHVEHSTKVDAGQPLIELRRSDLDYEVTRVLGETQTARTRLHAVQAERVAFTRRPDADRAEFDKLTAEEEQLKSTLQNLTKQHALLVEQQAELTVRAPLDGRVLTWDVDQLLEARPVRRGEQLLTVADTDGPWVLEMRIADNEVEHVLAARSAADKPLAVSFVLSPDPGTVFHGTVIDMSMDARTDGGQRPAVIVTAAFDAELLKNQRPGASVHARVDCGRESLGYVWFREAIEAVRTRLMF